MARWRLVTPFVVVGVLLPTQSAQAATEIPLRVTSANEGRPALEDDVLAWHQGNRRPDVLAQIGGGEPFQVNPGRTQGIMGDVDGTRLVYSQYPKRFPKKGDGDVKMVDLSSGARLPIPGKVNTKHEEYAPSLSGDWLMVGRAKFGKRYVDRILLINLATGEVRQLDKIRKVKQFIGTGQVNGGYAVWEWSPAGGPTQVFRYEIATGATVQVPNPQGLPQYGAGVGADGVVYFFRSGFPCGEDVNLMRWSPSTGEAMIHDFPAGVDAHRAYVHDDASGDRHIAYTRFTCGGGDPSDLYK
ncbi:MAG: hypothetical protein ACRDJP_07275, partial [Actinomycetota bacterium]